MVAAPARDLVQTIAGRYAILVALALVVIALSLGSAHFLTWRNLLNTVESGSIYGIVAIGLTVLMIGGQFDLCAGATFVLAGIVAARLQPLTGSGPALVAGLLAGTTVGLFNGLFVRWFATSSLPMPGITEARLGQSSRVCSQACWSMRAASGSPHHTLSRAADAIAITSPLCRSTRRQPMRRSGGFPPGRSRMP